MSSFLQTKSWMDFQKSLGRKVFEYDKDGIKARMIKYPLPFGKSYLYIPHGPEVDFNSMIGGENHPLANFISWLRETAKVNKSVFVKIEPIADHVAQVFAERRFKKSKKEIQPSKSVIIDLDKDEYDLLGAMHHKTRYNIKVAEKHNVEVDESDNAEAFWKLMKKTTARDKFSSHEKSFYEKLLAFDFSEFQVKMFFARHADKPVAAAIVLLHGDSAYYLHGASDHNHREVMAPFKLHWEIIKYLKTKGLKTYDLWGIDSKKWPGVTRFKHGWGGRVIEYPGSFDLPISGIWYLAYRIGQKIF